MQSGNAFLTSSPGTEKQLLNASFSQKKGIAVNSKKVEWDCGTITHLVLGQLEIHALALCIDNASDLLGTQWV